MRSALLLSLIGALAVSAQRPNDTSICDYYTTALLTNNTAANQYTLLTLLVNTAVIGNYTQPNVGVAVPGILNPNATYMGEAVNLVPYFSGELLSTNNNGTAVAVNFLDGGGAAPLMQNMAANDNSTNQYTLLTHLYSYFGVLLGCSQYGTTDFPAYAGSNSQSQVHRFMVLSNAENSYFIQQVGLSAASFGVAESDVTAVGMALGMLFNVRCSAPAVVVPGTEAETQSICQAPDCSYGTNGSTFCMDYPSPVSAPLPAASASGAAMSGAASSMAASMPASMAMGSASMPMPASAMMSEASAAASSMVARVRERRRRVV